MFDEEGILMAISGAKYEDGYYVFTSANAYKKYSINQSDGLPSFDFKENTRYTYSIYGYIESGNLYFYLKYYDEESTNRYIFNRTTEGKDVFTSPANTTLMNKQYLSYGRNGRVHISHIQLEEGATDTEFEPYYIKKDTTVVQKQNHTLKAMWEAI